MNNKISIYYTIALLASLGFASYIFSIVSSANKTIAIIASYLLVMSIAMLANLTWDSIGLSKDSLVKGFIYALPFIAVIVVGAIGVFLFKSEIFQDERYKQGSSLVLFTVFITLPFFTVLIEELAFRGVLFGMLQNIVSQNYAVILSSISFGVWHVFSANALSSAAIPATIPKVLVVVSVILATSIAGAFFTWLRLKSGSLITPILVHWTINSVGIILAYFAWQKA
jgi:membrane protease YdiL (CAAX protease family)